LYISMIIKDKGVCNVESIKPTSEQLGLRVGDIVEVTLDDTD